ncbi:hypothetical protein [Streptomyces halstedii]|uniref:hypothetical protein n=1 Tax=Streptomyces halstedii TaxID=1944 RepID=UPI0036491CC3
MAYGTGPATPVDRAIEDTYRAVLQHTESCPECRVEDATCDTAAELRAAHRTATREARC